MVTVKNGDVVTVHYTGSFENGEIFDSSEGREPLQFQVGAGQMISGFDEAVLGMAVNEEKEVTLPPEKAYGYRDDNLVKSVPRSMVGGQFEPAVGMTIGVQMENGQRVPATITEVTDESLSFDLNPPLAGKTLNFKIKITDISDAASCGCGPACSPSSCGSVGSTGGG